MISYAPPIGGGNAISSRTDALVSCNVSSTTATNTQLPISATQAGVCSLLLASHGRIKHPTHTKLKSFHIYKHHPPLSVTTIQHITMPPSQAKPKPRRSHTCMVVHELGSNQTIFRWHTVNLVFDPKANQPQRCCEGGLDPDASSVRNEQSLFSPRLPLFLSAYMRS